jgi:hypothetical protein
MGGKVIGLDGWPAKNAKIFIDGKETSATTTNHGRYQLRGSDLTVEGTENRMTSFTLSAEAIGYHFDHIKVNLKDETTELPEI